MTMMIKPNRINDMRRSVKSIAFAIVLTGLFLLTGGDVKAQFEPQFTQYMFNEMFINPAYAGSREQISATMV